MSDAVNTLVVLSDQHNPKMVGAAGHPMVRTPHMDALAARGTRFSAAYTPCPICVPARASFATGQYVHRIGYWDNANAYDGRVKGWGHALQAAGVPSLSIGKLHYRQADDPTGFDRQDLAMYIMDGVGQVWGLARNPLPVREGGELMVSTAGPGLSKYNEYDMAITKRACDWLTSAEAQKGPWVLYVGLVAPHFPYVVPEKWFDLYPAEEIPRAHPHPDDGFRPHPWVEKFLGVSPGIDRNTDEERRRCTAAYYGLCSFLDDNLGQIVRALEEAGLTDTTRVIYTSDHGDMVGRQGHWGKSLPYEDSAGIPMIAAGPGIPENRVSHTPVTLVDLAPAILEGAGLEPPAAFSGRSLVNIAGEKDDADRAVLSEYHAYGAVSAWFMIRKDRFKYVDYRGFEPELFDLETDPDELTNLASDAAHGAVLADLKGDLSAILDPNEVDRRAMADQLELIEKYGGLQKVLEMGNPSATPTPLG